MADLRLNSSKLGTEQYWNEFYQKERANFTHNEEDTGECWFDDSDAENKMIQFLVDKISNQELPETLAQAEVLKFVDLGTGNGHLLFELYGELKEECAEIEVKLTGIDYSADSVTFANDIRQRKFNQPEFSFEQVDLLVKDNSFFRENSEKFDILLDKGTLDAIALNQDPIEDFDGCIGMDIYSQQVSRLMHSGSILLITSCNFTEDELVKIITGNNSQLNVWDKITYPTFQFGGAKGSTICSIAFIKH